MNAMCEQIIDMLPERAADVLPATVALAVDEHVRTCASCAAELALIRALRVTAPVPNAVQLDRVRHAVRSRKPNSSWGVRELAIAATIAVVLIGGALVVEQAKNSAAVASAPTTTVDTEVVTVTDDALLRGGAVSKLNEEQLEALLAEMDS